MQGSRKMSPINKKEINQSINRNRSSRDREKKIARQGC